MNPASGVQNRSSYRSTSGTLARHLVAVCRTVHGPTSLPGRPSSTHRHSGSRSAAEPPAAAAPAFFCRPLTLRAKGNRASSACVLRKTVGGADRARQWRRETGATEPSSRRDSHGSTTGTGSASGTRPERREVEVRHAVSFGNQLQRRDHGDVHALGRWSRSDDEVDLAALAVAKEQRRRSFRTSRSLVIVVDVADQRRAPRGLPSCLEFRAVVWMHDHPDLHEGHWSPAE